MEKEEQAMEKNQALSDADLIALADQYQAETPSSAATRIIHPLSLRLTARNAELAELRKVVERVKVQVDHWRKFPTYETIQRNIAIFVMDEALAPAQKEASEPVCICHTPVRSDYREPVPDPNCPKHSPAPHDPTAATEARERDKWCSKRLPSGMYEPLPAFRVLMDSHGFSKRDIEIIWNDIARMAEYLAAASARKE